MLKKRVRKIVVSICLAMLVLSTYIFASAAEASGKTIDGKNHTVYEFGGSVMLILQDRIEVVPNNSTKLIDVMVDGKVTKGLEYLVLLQPDNKLSLEGGALVVKCKSEEQVASIKKIIASGLENNKPIQSVGEIKTGLSDSSVEAYVLDDSGVLLNSEGNKAAGMNLGLTLISNEAAYNEAASKAQETPSTENAPAQEPSSGKKTPSTTSAPTTSEAPVATSEAPVATSEAPVATSEAPVATSEAPRPTE